MTANLINSFGIQPRNSTSPGIIFELISSNYFRYKIYCMSGCVGVCFVQCASTSTDATRYAKQKLRTEIVEWCYLNGLELPDWVRKGMCAAVCVLCTKPSVHGLSGTGSVAVHILWPLHVSI